MAFSIALAGKGGTGKTTVAGMLIRHLVNTERSPVLGVDADSNANLNEVLGLEVTDTLGNAREEMKKGVVPSGMTKDVFMSMKLEQAIVETKGFDLVVTTLERVKRIVGMCILKFDGGENITGIYIIEFLTVLSTESKQL